MSQERLANLLDEAVEKGVISEEERVAVLSTDIVVEGKRQDQPAALLAEVSFTVDRYDVERAAERAKVLAKVLNVPVVAVVGGAFVDDSVWPLARELGVEVLQDQWSASRTHAPPRPSSSLGKSSHRKQVCERPPSTGSVTPVIQAALGEARKAIASATSSGWPILPKGWVDAECWRKAW